ncbi:MAG: hypothetical protein J5988_09885, partial [Eubacterium sp.]|nr:hypothetical protein [Eubacterium sp.]
MENRIRNKKNENREENKMNEKQLHRDQILELKKKKKEMEEELDELKGKTSGGKVQCALVFLGVLAICFGIFAGLVKTDTGNFASEILAPLIADVPVMRSILPAELQQKSQKEIAAEQAAAQSDASGAGTGTAGTDASGAGTGTAGTDTSGAGTGTAGTDASGAGTGTAGTDASGAGTGTAGT